MSPTEIMARRKQKEIKDELKSRTELAQKEVQLMRKATGKPTLSPMGIDAAARSIGWGQGGNATDPEKPAELNDVVQQMRVSEMHDIGVCCCCKRS